MGRWGGGGGQRGQPHPDSCDDGGCLTREHPATPPGWGLGTCHCPTKPINVYKPMETNLKHVLHTVSSSQGPHEAALGSEARQPHRARRQRQRRQPMVGGHMGAGGGAQKVGRGTHGCRRWGGGTRHRVPPPDQTPSRARGVSVGGWEKLSSAPGGGVGFPEQCRPGHRCSSPVLWPRLHGPLPRGGQRAKPLAGEEARRPGRHFLPPPEELLVSGVRR